MFKFELCILQKRRDALSKIIIIVASLTVAAFMVTVNVVQAGDAISDAFEDTFGHDKIPNAFEDTFGHNRIPDAFNNAFGGGSSRHKAKKLQPQNSQSTQH